MQQVLVYSDSLTWGIIPDLGCHFFDSGSVTSASAIDGIHLDAGQHPTLGKALAQVVSGLPGVLTAPAA